MVNLMQAWAERYRAVRPDVVVEVAGGGSGVGIASLVTGLADVAAASREMSPDERLRFARAARTPNRLPLEFAVALDALAVYVHRANPLDTISIDELAEIYGEDGTLHAWSQLGARPEGCTSDRIVRIGRQSSSGTYVYFREAILGRRREYALGSIDQSGSKDVVALVSRTPCAIGYSGLAYVTPGVKALAIAVHTGARGVSPTPETASNGTYPLARRLYFYTAGAPAGETKAFVDWVLAPVGQTLTRELGFVALHEANP